MKHGHMALAVLAALALSVAGPALAFSADRSEMSSGQNTVQAGSPPSLLTLQYSFRSVAQRVLPVVVEVDVTEQVKNTAQGQAPFNKFFDQNPGNDKGGKAPRRQGLGSGILVKRAGDTYYVLTNNHVVDGAADISVKLDDQQVFKARVVGSPDPRRDLAIVSFTSNANLAIATLGDSSDLQVGDLVLAVGNPYGFENTVTMGIISALGRDAPGGGVGTNTSYIQTDAAINQGNSGGALVNIRGEVVGINSWIAAPTGGSIGLGFAIPINNAKKAIDDFINKGKVEYGFLGVQPTDPQVDSYPGVARDLGVENVKGALIVNVYRNSAAARAGLLPGDYVVRVDGHDIANSNKLVQVVSDLYVGQSYDFDLIRYGEQQKLSIKLAVRPEEGSDATAYKNLWTGITVVHVNDKVRERSEDSRIPKGVDGVMIGYVATGNTPDDQSPAAIAGFRPYDIITQINGKDVHNVMDYYQAINDRSKTATSFKIIRQGTEVDIRLTS